MISSSIIGGRRKHLVTRMRANILIHDIAYSLDAFVSGKSELVQPSRYRGQQKTSMKWDTGYLFQASNHSWLALNLSSFPKVYIESRLTHYSTDVQMCPLFFLRFLRASFSVIHPLVSEKATVVFRYADEPDDRIIFTRSIEKKCSCSPIDKC